MMKVSEMNELLEKAKRNIEYAMEAEADSPHPDPARVSLATAQVQVLIVIAGQLGRLAAHFEDGVTFVQTP